MAVSDILAEREQINESKVERISVFVWMKGDVSH